MSFDASFARHYDSFSGADYALWTRLLTNSVAKHAAIPVHEVLDLCCGTGALSLMLAGSGYDVVALDFSGDMLSRAHARDSEGSVLFLEQDMRSFELYGSVQAAVCAYDGFNYLRSAGELEKVLMLLNNYIDIGGLLLFDINTPYRYREVFADNSFVFEGDKVMLVWQNNFNLRTGVNLINMTIFEEQSDRAYARFDRIDRQRCFSPDSIKKLLKKAGFGVREILGDEGNFPDGDEEKLYFVAVNEKKCGNVIFGEKREKK